MLTENPAPLDECAPFPARELPHNNEAEQALLGALLIHNGALDRVERLEPDHFFQPLHRQIFTEIRRTILAGRLASPVTLMTVFEHEEPLADTCTVPQYLGRLAANATTIINVPDYATTIIDLAKRRELVEIGEQIVRDAYHAPVTVAAADQIVAAESALFSLVEHGAGDRGEVPFADAAARAVKMAEEAFVSKGRMRGLSTGLVDLDRKLGGLQASDLIILAGRPSMGKTALATNMAWNVARSGLSVDFRSLEMSADQLASRIIAGEVGIASDKFRRGDLTEVDMAALTGAETRLRNTPLIIDETGGLSIAQLAAKARRTKRKHDTALIVVDYLQLITGTKRRDGSRVHEVTEITTGLKALAKELQVPIIALSQLSRQVEGRTEKRPQLADLRESGSIEQDADVVLFVFREEYYLERQEPDPTDSVKYAAWQAELRKVAGKAEVIVGKQRHGPTGIVPLQFDGALTRFSSLAGGIGF